MLARIRRALPVHPTAVDPRTGERLVALGVLPSGRIVWPVMGGDDSNDGGQGGQGGAAGGGSGSGGAAAARFTQDDMNATVARETEKARQQAATDLAAQLGVTVDEAKQIITQHREAEQARMTQAQRDAAAAEQAKRDAEAKDAAAALDRHAARVERLLGRAGLDITNPTLLAAGLAAVQVPVGADDTAIQAAVDKAQADAPNLFGAAAGGGVHGDPGSGGGGRGREVPGGEFGSKGKAEAARRWGNKQTA